MPNYGTIRAGKEVVSALDDAADVTADVARGADAAGDAARGAPALGGFAKAVTPAEVRAINEQFGGATELMGTVEGVLAQAGYHQGFYGKAAVVIRGIAHGHLFDNGNKRTAQAVYELLRSRNGITTGVSAHEVRRIINDVATGTLTDIDEIATALRGF